MDNELILGALGLALLFFSAYLVVYFVIKLDRFLLKIKNFIVKLEWMVNTLQHYAYVILFLFILVLALAIYNAYCTLELLVYRHQCKKSEGATLKMRLNLFKYIFRVKALAKQGKTNITRLLKRAKRATKWALICTIITAIVAFVLYGMVWVFHNMMNQYSVINYYTINRIAKKQEEEEDSFEEEKDDNRHGLEDKEEDTIDDRGNSTDGTAIIFSGLATMDEYKKAIKAELKLSEDNNVEYSEQEALIDLDCADRNTLAAALKYYNEHKDDDPDEDAVKKVEEDITKCTYDDLVKADPYTYTNPYVLMAINEAAKENEVYSAGLIVSKAEEYKIEDALEKAKNGEKPESLTT